MPHPVNKTFQKREKATKEEALKSAWAALIYIDMGVGFFLAT